MLKHYARAKVKKRSSVIANRVRISRMPVLSLMMLHYNLFVIALLKEANNEARLKKSKITKQEHVRAVAKRILKKYRR